MLALCGLCTALYLDSMTMHSLNQQLPRFPVVGCCWMQATLIFISCMTLIPLIFCFRVYYAPTNTTIATQDCESTLLDQDVSYSQIELSTDPLGITQLEEDPEHAAEEKDQQKPVMHSAQDFFYAGRKRSLAVLFFLSIGPGLFFLGFFDVAYVRGLCVPFMAIAAYFVCRLSFIPTTPDADSDGQSSHEEEGCAQDTAVYDDDYAFGPFLRPVLRVGLPVIVCLIVVTVFPLPLIFLSPWLFSVYFVRDHLKAQVATEDRGAYELPRVGVGVLEKDHSYDAPVERDDQGQELIHSTTPATETTPLIVHGVQVV